MSHPISRRRMLTQAVQLSIGGALALSGISAATAADGACVDVSSLDSGQANSRKTLHWAAMSPHKDKTCAGCAFFQSTSGACGTCMIFMGPTYAAGYCDSWAAKGG